MLSRKLYKSNRYIRKRVFEQLSVYILLVFSILLIKIGEIISKYHIKSYEKTSISYLRDSNLLVGEDLQLKILYWLGVAYRNADMIEQSYESFYCFSKSSNNEKKKKKCEGFLKRYCYYYQSITDFKEQIKSFKRVRKDLHSNLELVKDIIPNYQNSSTHPLYTYLESCIQYKEGLLIK